MTDAELRRHMSDIITSTDYLDVQIERLVRLCYEFTLCSSEDAMERICAYLFADNPRQLKLDV